ncbi:D-cysteine desulfhydrase family protein [Natrialbaceae archaeon A-arb3/5]
MGNLSKSLRDRIELYDKPTPVKKTELLPSHPSSNIWIKRDDLTSIGAGGNKARKLEYIAADAVAENADTLVTIGSVQSNHARMTAAVAAKLGFDCHLILITDTQNESNVIKGNRLLETILEVDITYTSSSDASNQIDHIVDDLQEQGKNPYFIQGGGHTVRGALGYVQCVKEIVEQVDDSIDYIITPTGTGTTHAGIIFGLQYMDYNCEVIGISVARTTEQCKNEINDILYGLEEEFDTVSQSSADPTVYDEYIGEEGYGTFTERAREAIKTVAQTEGIFLEPTYSGKAFGGMMDLLEKGHIDSGSNIIFLHSGGFPGLFVSRFETDSVWTK